MRRRRRRRRGQEDKMEIIEGIIVGGCVRLCVVMCEELLNL